jgi:two-component system cell cycle sensor histidine kinase/response regulator CckA
MQEDHPKVGPTPGTILLVEDEDEIRSLMSGILTASGYTVIEANNGDNAIEQYVRLRDSISVVLTDLSLPKVNGQQVLETIRNVNPSARVVVCSGYLDEKRKSELMRLGVTEMLDKPYSVNKLLEVVGRLSSLR